MSAAPPILENVVLPDINTWSKRVTMALGQNPSIFAGPGTNSYILGTGSERFLIDPGEGRETYLPILEQAMQHAGCERIAGIVLTHGHPDHIGGLRSVMEWIGRVPVWKFPYEPFDAAYADIEIHPLADGDRLTIEGASLLSLHTPGHAPDHLCFLLEEEQALFTGDNVLGVGTTIIPTGSGDLGDYMHSLNRLKQTSPTVLYPAHGPKIQDGPAKIDEYIAHRHQREKEILSEVSKGPRDPLTMVRIIYAAYPEHLHGPACHSVGQHLVKLEREGRVARSGPHADDPARATWRPI